MRLEPSCLISGTPNASCFSLLKLCLLFFCHIHMPYWICVVYGNISAYSLDRGRKLNVYKMFKIRVKRLLNILCTFNLRLVPSRWVKKVKSEVKISRQRSLEDLFEAISFLTMRKIHSKKDANQSRCIFPTFPDL